MKKPYLFFDAGGTVVFLSFDVFRREAAKHDIRLDEAAFSGALARLGFRHDQQRLQGLSQQESFAGRHYFRLILEELGVDPKMAEAIKDGIVAINARRNIWSASHAWVGSSLRELMSMGYDMSIISNTDGRVREQLQDAGIVQYFARIFDSKLIGRAKPDPAFFIHCCTDLGLRPEECLYIGDSLAIDVLGANNAGMPAVLVDEGDLYGAWGGLRIGTVRELPALLQRHADIYHEPGAFILPRS